jgi:hypothetical protein
MGKKRSSRDANQRRMKTAPKPGPIVPNSHGDKPIRPSGRPARSRRKLRSARERERNTKRLGELVEIKFAHVAMSKDFAVCKPYGDSERYDTLLDSREPNIMPKLSRVQIKCSTQLCGGFYRVNAHRRIHGRAVPYKPTEIDFIAAYIIPEDTWYIIPIAAVRGTSLLFRPKGSRKRGLYDQYREAWHLLRQEKNKT